MVSVKKYLSFLHYMYMSLTQISTCDLCQRNSQKLSILTQELFLVPVHSPWHHVGIDFVGPISPKTVIYCLCGSIVIC